MASSSNPRPRSRDLVALTVLALLCERPMHPYEMQRLIRERRKDFAAGRPRSLYHAVASLTRRGLIEPVSTSREGRRPERTVFRATESGREELAEWLAELLSTVEREFPVFEAAISLMAGLPRATVLAALRRRSVALESWIASLTAANRALQAQLGLPRVVLLELDYSTALFQAEREWVGSVIRDLEDGSLSWGVPPVAAESPGVPVGSVEEET